MAESKINFLSRKTKVRRASLKVKITLEYQYNLQMADTGRWNTEMKACRHVRGDELF